MSFDLVKQTAEIVKAYASFNQLSPAEVLDLMRQVHGTLSSLAAGEGGHPMAGEADREAMAVESRVVRPMPVAPRAEKRPVVQARPEPAVPVEEAVREDVVICLLCGKGCQALKGHLTRSHKMELEEYRRIFNLPRDFPMVSRGYSARRRQLAIDAGLAEKLQKARRKAAAK